MKQSRFHERVLANALGFANNAFKPLRGVARVEARGAFAGVLAVLTSFVSKFANRGTKKQKADRYPNGFNKTCEMARRVRQRETGIPHGWRDA